MEIVLPTTEQVAFINDSRTRQGELMDQAGTLDGPLVLWMGPCAPDGNRHPDGELATVKHEAALHEAAEELPDVEYEGRGNGTKPRTRGGTTGLIHEDPAAYGEMVERLTSRGIRIVAEVMDESDAAIAGPWLTSKWAGTRNLEDTGVRQLLRPTEAELESGIVPAPSFVKSDAYGRWDPTINTLHTLRDSKPVRRSRLTLNGLERVVTHANPHTGIILRGRKPRPDGPLDDILAAEITEARDKVDSEFGEGEIAVYVDVSHGHAAWEGGGEEGQMAVAESLGRLMLQGIIVDGVMAETYLLSGKQENDGTIPGLSQVDKCVRQAGAISMMQLLNDARANQQLALYAALRQ
jgi:phospho-2-dehydro-3-deoxyheptonate aldolase